MKQQLSYLMGDGHNVTGEIPVSYDNTVFEDIEKNIVLKKSNIASHYDFVMSTVGDSYKGINKYTYGNILQAIKTIVDSKKNQPRSSDEELAIAYLHGEMLFSSVTIQRIFLLFGKKMSMSKILDDASRVFEHRPAPVWLQRLEVGVY